MEAVISLRFSKCDDLLSCSNRLLTCDLHTVCCESHIKKFDLRIGSNVLLVSPCVDMEPILKEQCKSRACIR